MKLIDILVREKIHFPSGAKQAVQDYDKTVKFFDSHNLRLDIKRWTGKPSGEFYCISEHKIKNLPLSEDWNKSIVTREQYESALAASIAKREPVAEWDGVGLPPVGCICEALVSSGVGDLWEWAVVKVVESGIKGSEKECLVYNIETTCPSWVDEFRTLRTEADKKRDDEVSAMMHIGLSLPAAIPFTREEMQALYDAGYRKIDDAKQ